MSIFITDKKTPLHYVLWQQRHFSTAVLLNILFAYPAGSSIRERKYGNYPLHYAVQYGAHVNIVREILNCYKEAVRLKNFAGKAIFSLNS